MKKTYLGDGLYAHYDGYQFYLTAPRFEGEHMVALDAHILQSFLRYVERVYNATILIKFNVEKDSPNHSDDDPDGTVEH